MTERKEYCILTGAMGAGKTTILSKLRDRGIRCVSEPARQILAEQRLVGGVGVPEQNAEMFCMLMLSRAIHEFETNTTADRVIVFDRSIPDLIAYARWFRIDETPYQKAASEFRFNSTVLYLPEWKEIYANDSERKMSFEQARDFGRDVRAVYEELGYQIEEVPKGPVDQRVRHVLSFLDS